MQQVCQLFDKELLDHYIVGKEGVYSLAAANNFECKHAEYLELASQMKHKNKSKQLGREFA